MPQVLDTYSRKTGVQLVMVIDVELQTSGASKTSNDVSNELDRALLLHLRGLSDLAITDVATASFEKYKSSRLLPIEVWSKSGNFRDLVSIAPAEGRRGLRLRTVADLNATIHGLLADYESILLETGFTLTKQLADKHLIDHAAVTVTGATDEKSALNSLAEFSGLAGFDYLKFESQDWLENTQFARFQR